MGKNFFNKLGSILKAFKGVKKKDQEEFIDITSDSGTRSFGSSSNQLSSEFKKKLNLFKSKSIESLSTTLTADSGNIKVNQLKRTTATCDILNNTKELKLECTKSLHRFGHLTHTNQFVFSYNAKLHDSSMWSKAFGRAAGRPIYKKIETDNYSNTPMQSEVTHDPSLTTNLIPLGKLAYNHSNEVGESMRKETGINTGAQTTLEVIPSSTILVTNTFQEDKIDCIDSKKINNSLNYFKPFQTVNVMRVEEKKMNEVDYSPKCLRQDSQLVLDENQMTLKMDLKTIKNEHGFDLLKYDIQSSGDHETDGPSITGVVVDQSSLKTVQSSKILSENTTEYEVVNLTQVDLFREFKTTISKMRNVLNVLEVKKPLKCILDGSVDDQTINQNPMVAQDGENISTQTTNLCLNQISTSTEREFCSQTKNEGVMVQLSSETTSKHFTLGSNLLKQLYPITKRKKLKKRGCKCKNYKMSKKTLSSFTSYDGKLKNKKGKNPYHKCIVYHITQQKKAMDRCVGTSSSTTKEDLVVKDTFNALDFGQMKQFPMLQDKHKNEKKKELEQKIRIKSLDQNKNDHISHRRSTSFLSSGTSYNSTQNSCFKCKTRSSLNCTTSKEYFSTSDSKDKANWFVYKPSPPVLVKQRPSTSDNLILDKTRSSTHELVSNIIHEEFKTSGIKGKISSSTMNMIKDQFCDELSGVKTKNVPPDAMITVCVPLKSIVSKINTSKRAPEDKRKTSTTASADTSSRNKSSMVFDKSIQVEESKKFVNDNLQIIPEKIGKKSTEIYHHNKMRRESMSSKRLSTFKKVFGNKTTSCSNFTPLGRLTPRTSKIYYYDHSTSSPDFDTKPNLRKPSHSSRKNNPIVQASSFMSLPREESSTHLHKKEGFFLNLPTHRYKKMRERLSRLFDSDSSEARFFTEPKLLYHVHESSFYSTSRTEDKVSSRRLVLDTFESQEQVDNSYIPIQKGRSKVDLKSAPKFISFSDLPRNLGSPTEVMVEAPSEPIKIDNQRNVLPKVSQKDVIVNTSNNRFLRDNETQFEHVDSASSITKGRPSRSSRKIINSDQVFNNCVDEFSMLTSPKVHFEDEMNVVGICENTIKLDNCKEDIEECECKKQVDGKITVEERPQQTVSNLSLFPDDEMPLEGDSDKLQDKMLGTSDFNADSKKMKLKKCKNMTMKNIILQTSSRSSSNTILKTQRDFGVQLVNTESITRFEKKNKRKRYKNLVKMEATQVNSIPSFSRTENCLVQADATVEPKNDNKLAGLMREVVDLCNDSFVKSRDCIVELTLYNLIKEIILEHCAHLNEKSKQKVETILSNFIQVSKQKAGTENVDIVESAIENLVKEIGSSEFAKKQRMEGYEEDASTDKVFLDEDSRRESEYKYRGKHRSKSKRREHKCESKYLDRHREFDLEQGERHRYKEEQRKHRSKRHHRHRYDDEMRYEMDVQGSEGKLRSVDGKKEYMELVQRLKELEEVTKQLSTVAHNQNTSVKVEEEDQPEKKDKLYNASKSRIPDVASRRNMKLKLTKFDKMGKNFHIDPVNVNFFQAKTKHPIFPIPRNYPKLPVTKIVINLSNLKLLARNCSSLKSTFAKDRVCYGRKQKLINQIVSYEIGNKQKVQVEHSLKKMMEKRGSRKENVYGTMNENKESLSITMHGKPKNRSLGDIQTKPLKRKKDFMRIKMVKKKKTVSSTTNSTSNCHCLRKGKEILEPFDINRVTEEYIKKEFKINSDLLYHGMAKELLKSGYDIKQLMEYRGKVNETLQRIIHFYFHHDLLMKNIRD